MDLSQQKGRLPTQDRRPPPHPGQEGRLPTQDRRAASPPRTGGPPPTQDRRAASPPRTGGPPPHPGQEGRLPTQDRRAASPPRTGGPPPTQDRRIFNINLKTSLADQSFLGITSVVHGYRYRRLPHYRHNHKRRQRMANIYCIQD